MTIQSHIRKLDELRSKALSELDVIRDNQELELWRISYLGRSGELTLALRNLSNLSQEERPVVGSAGNKLKLLLEEHLSNRKKNFDSEFLQGLDATSIDISLPSRLPQRGRLHPTTMVLREICGIFGDLGFRVLEGPEVEWDYYNFEKLNIPKHHPARDMWDTLWVDQLDGNGGQSMLLRTHTSPMQARIMEQSNPPVRVLIPGKCYRYEATDPTHESQFYQVEGLAVDEGISFANLKHTLFEFARRMFGVNRKVRFRCDYFPFVEPGVDMSIDCFACDGSLDSGCRVCRGSGWIEILGAGMVHPKVLQGLGYDSTIYTGFAFGMGPERIAMLKYGIDDVRLFYNNDIRFLRQFS